jgi:histidine triad (HIT) family protein
MHEPPNYVCPFCELISGKSDHLNRVQDIVYKDEDTLAFVAPKWWVNNPGHVLVVPLKHYENIYSIPDNALTKVYITVKKIATAIRATYNCEGTSTRQHNEPAGNQDVWHFHVHVFPRHENDHLYKNHENKRWIKPPEKDLYIEKLKTYFKKQGS